MYSVCFGVSIALLFLIVFSKKRVSELGLLLLIITKLQHYTEWLTNYEYYCNWNTWIIIPPCQRHCGHHFPHPPAPSPHLLLLIRLHIIWQIKVTKFLRQWWNMIPFPWVCLYSQTASSGSLTFLLVCNLFCI